MMPPAASRRCLALAAWFALVSTGVACSARVKNEEGPSCNPACPATACGQVDDGCGGVLTCGSCTPAAPAGLSAVAAEGQVTLSWSASERATGYHVYRRSPSDTAFSEVAGDALVTTGWIGTGLTNGVTYSFQVTAYNTSGESPPSATVQATPQLPTSPPPAPAGLTAAAADGQVFLSWSAATGATRYHLWRRAASEGSFTEIAQPTATAAAATGLTNGTEYSFYVTASNSRGTGPASATVSATPRPGTPRPVFVHPASPEPPALHPPAWDLPETSDFTPSIVASRTSGVAPLYVHFDATASLPAVNGDVDVLATYLWSFDTSGVDAETAYERVSGFVAGHVFNVPGTYTVRLDVFDRTGRHGHATQRIEVLPFTGTTYYVSAQGSDSNPGTMAAPFLTAKHALTELPSYANVRVLFRNGDTFPVREAFLRGPGPAIVSGYSDPQHPSPLLPELHSDSTDDNWWVLVLADTSTDWRIVGLKVTSGGHTSSPRYPNGIAIQGSQDLVSRCDVQQVLYGFGVSGLGDSAFHENEVHRIGAYGFYADAAQRVSVIGNFVHDMDSDHQEHGYRMQAGDGYFLGFNVIEATDAKSGVQVRGSSHRVVVYSNVLDRSSGVHPQNKAATPHEEQHHVVLDGNVFVGRRDPAYDNGFPVRQTALELCSHDTVVRNNVFHDYEWGAAIDDCSGGAGDNWRSQRVVLQHNTVVCPDAAPGCGFFTDAGLDVSVHGNLQLSLATSSNMYDRFFYPPGAPEASNYNQLFGAAWSTSMPLFGAATLAGWQATGQDRNSYFATPGISVSVLTSAGYGIPAATSPGVDHGPPTSLTGNWADIRGRVRDAHPDIGAFERLP